MRRPKACDLCGQKLALHTCANCGAQVCDQHYDKRTGLCTNCLIKK